MHSTHTHTHSQTTAHTHRHGDVKKRIKFWIKWSKKKKKKYRTTQQLHFLLFHCRPWPPCICEQTIIDLFFFYMAQSKDNGLNKNGRLLAAIFKWHRLPAHPVQTRMHRQYLIVQNPVHKEIQLFALNIFVNCFLGSKFSTISIRTKFAAECSSTSTKHNTAHIHAIYSKLINYKTLFFFVYIISFLIQWIHNLYFRRANGHGTY